jgi:predicted PurR-regulated permease PerM
MKSAPDRRHRSRRPRAATPGSAPGPTPKAAPHPYLQVALFVVASLLVWKLAGALLLLFSAILLAAALSAIADGLRKLAPIPTRVAVLLAALLMIGVLGGVLALFGWRILVQYEEILGKARESLRALMTYTRAQSWGDALLKQANGARISDATDTLAPILGSVVSGAARYLTYAAIVFVCGIFLALNPTRYRDGALLLVPESHSAEASAFLMRSADILKRWLVSRLIVMVALGVLVSIGLTVLRISGAVTLGLTGGLLTFIPFLGALMAAVPAVLVAFTVSPLKALLTGLMFWGAHFIEGTFITPLVQDESVDLPPVLTIFSTLAFTVIFGPSGVLLASPLVLVIITAIQVFYLEGHLGRPLVLVKSNRHPWRWPWVERAKSPAKKA